VWSARKKEGPAKPATEVGENSLGAVTPGETHKYRPTPLVYRYISYIPAASVGTNKREKGGSWKGEREKEREKERERERERGREREREREKNPEKERERERKNERAGGTQFSFPADL
jgi:hypothetical protein